MRKQRCRSAANYAADQPLCFCYIDYTNPLLHKSEISSLLPSSVALQPGLCWTWSETPQTDFLMMQLISTNLVSCAANLIPYGPGFQPGASLSIILLTRELTGKFSNCLECSEIKKFLTVKTYKIYIYYIMYINPYVTNGLSHPYHLDESTFFFRGIRSNFLFFISLLNEKHVSKQNSPRWDAAFSQFVPFCLPMSHRKDARLIWVKHSILANCI